ncbi:hypothetical protein CBS101457_006315 [Exobasidium rhododendri]|nr:hypothetical protein CBS101457_006315 [Exobasidium rhododendri]
MATAAVASGSTPNIDGMLLLEGPFARAPHDELRRQLRSQQRLVERDMAFCSTTLASLAPSAVNSGMNNDADQVQPSSLIGDTSYTGDTSFMSEGTRADESVMTIFEGEEEGEAEKSFSTSKAKNTDLEKSLDVMLGRLKGLKRKLTSVHDSTQLTLTQLDARTKHLNELHRISNTSSSAFDDWCRTRLDRMLVDWMLRKGYSDTAQTLTKSRKIENYVDLDLFAEISRIEASLSGMTLPDGTTVNRTCGPTLTWCSENKAALRKIKSNLEFDLRLQEFIEMTRSRDARSLQDAISYSRKHLLPLLSSAPKIATTTTPSTSSLLASEKEKEEREEKEQVLLVQVQVGRVMGLLACGPGGWAYEDLYSNSRWQTLQATFRACALQIHSLPPQPILHVALSAGLSSLKLPACYADEKDASFSAPTHLGGRAFGDDRSNLLRASGLSSTSVTVPPSFPPAAGLGSHQESANAPALILSPPGANSNIDLSKAGTKHAHQSKSANCPVCDGQGLGVLAKEIPWSHHANSTLVCTITGKIMDENDPPMALPNGRVYSRTALEELALNSKDGETVTCPRTGDSFPYSTLRKVFIS